MIRQPLQALMASSTTAHVNRFLRETQLSGSVPNLASGAALPHESPETQSDLLSFGSTPQLHVEVAPDSSERPDANANNNNAYKKMLKYKANEDFRGEMSSIGGASVPNTFKHKSHPNARTKERIGLAIPSEEHLPMENISLNPVKTSTMRGLSMSNDNSHEEGNTPSWMPPGLEHKWEDSGNDLLTNNNSNDSVRMHEARSGDRALDFLNSESNTFVHNVPASDQAPASTPLWKRMTEEYQSSAKRPLQSIFQSVDDSSEKDTKNEATSTRQNSKVGHSALTLFSTTSTPVATRDSDMHLTQQQIHQLEDMLEKAKDKPDDYQIKGSPLKLFGSEYDTFTKAVLSRFVEKVRSNASSIQREQLPVQMHLSAPKLNIKNFTKHGDYTEQDFKKNANNLFANIQKKARNGSHIFNRPSNESLSMNKSHSHSHTTATSTPKTGRALDLDEIVSVNAYSPYSTDFDESSSVAEFGNGDNHESTNGERHEYTSIEKTMLDQGSSSIERDFDIEEENATSYTFDDLTDMEAADVDESVRKGRKSVETTGYSEFASSVKQYPNHRKQSSVSGHSTSLSFDTSDSGQADPLIKWKRASQLKLPKSSSNPNVMRSSSASNIVKGTVKPGNFPDKYGNMVFDFQTNKWISDDKENDYPGSLDSIEDLFSETGEQITQHQRRDVSILKLKDRPSREKNLEVSFQVPNSTTESVQPKGNFDVTNLSQMGDMTFTQSNKRLISLITGSIDESAWELITSIDLSNKNLERVEALDNYLPSLRRMNVSNNHLEFIEGMPDSLIDLNISHNRVGNITSFKKFRDLLILNVSFNGLTSLSCFSYNLHLTSLVLNHNKVRNLGGLGVMYNLLQLDLSSNELSGQIDFGKFEFPSLQILNLSENRIQSVTGVENLPKLRVLNLNDNSLEKFTCVGRHSHLKKLLLKFNKLKELDLDPFPFLRILRIDGNSFTSIGDFKKLKFLDELSAKCQNSSSVVTQIVNQTFDISNLDLSGNYVISALLSDTSRIQVFANLNLLNLSAVALTSLPESFGTIFENVRELNLNFNKLTCLEGLKKLCRLKKVSTVSNNMTKLEMVLSSLGNSRATLKLLDLRLNVFNFEIYPFVFNPHELEIAAASGFSKFESSPIPLEAYDDIENFSIHYNTLIKSQHEWEERDADFFKQMRLDGDYKRINERLSYETILIKFFPKLKNLDGGNISLRRRAQAESRIHIQSDKLNSALLPN